MRADGRHRRQRVPGPELLGQIGVLQAVTVEQFDDHVGTTGDQHLSARLHRLLPHLGKDIVSAGDLEHVVQKTVAAAGVNVAQRRRVALEHQQRCGTRQRRGPGADRCERAIHSRRHRIGPRGRSDPDTERPDGGHDVAQRLVLVVEVRDPGTIQPLDQFLLRGVDDDQIGLDGENALDAGIQQAADPRQARHVRRKMIVVADRGDAGAVADRVDHLGDRRDQRDDPLWLRGRRSGGHRAERCGHRRDGHEQERQTPRHPHLLTSNHRKNGPPISAVMMPTGSSPDDQTVRAIASHAMRNAAPKSADAGRTRRWSEPTISRTRWGTTRPMKPTGPASETAAPVASDALGQRKTLGGDHVHAARGRGVGAEADEIERARQRRQQHECDHHDGKRGHDRHIAADVERAHQPAHGPKGVGEIGQVLREQDQRLEEGRHRDAGQQQNDGREAAPPRRRQRVDDAERANRAGEAGDRDRRRRRQPRN